MKYRGSGFAGDEFPISLTAEGLQLTNRGPSELKYEVTDERISTGLPRLDHMLRGGYHRGSNVLISGAPGTAKSTLSGLFAAAACERGERTLYVSFDEGANQIVRNLRSVGIHLAPHLKSGLLEMYSTRTRGPNVEDQFADLRAKVREHKPRCLVIDPLSALSTKLVAPRLGRRGAAVPGLSQGRRHHGRQYLLDGRAQHRRGDGHRHLDDRRHLDPPLVRRAGRRAQPRADDRQVARHRPLEPGARAHAVRRAASRSPTCSSRRAKCSWAWRAGNGSRKSARRRSARTGRVRSSSACSCKSRRPKPSRDFKSSRRKSMPAAPKSSVLALATGSASQLLTSDQEVAAQAASR